MCSNWLEMKVSRSSTMDNADADFFLYSEPPPIDELIVRHKKGRLRSKTTGRELPLIIICLNVEEAIQVSRNQSKALSDLGRIVEVVPQPCGPRKLARVLKLCMKRVEEMAAKQRSEGSGQADTDMTGEREDQEDDAGHDKPITSIGIPERGTLSPSENTSSANSPPRPDEKRRKVSYQGNDERNMPLSAAVSFPSPPPLDPATPSLAARVSSRPLSSAGAPGQSSNAPHVLLVDDNKINLQLLVMFMKKLSYSYTRAENGLEALNRFKESCLPGPNHLTETGGGAARMFDFVLMDISMPIM